MTWRVASSTSGKVGDRPTLTKELIGHVDNTAFPRIQVDLHATFTVPADTNSAVPMMVVFTRPIRGQLLASRPGAAISLETEAMKHGWGYVLLDTESIQPDNAPGLRTGIIGLTNHGAARKPDEWGALRAWQWGASRLIDYFEENPDSRVDAKKVGIEGVSRYGKAALVTQAFDSRVAVGLIASSGEGGAKLYRHVYGETVENLAGGEFYWMAGNFLKYAAADCSSGAKTTADLPIDSHEFIALCAPRPCFISYGTVDGGDPKWVDARGSYMAGVLASPVYRLLGKRGFGSSDYLTEAMPSVGQFVGGELAWRQHEGGHDVTPNWPYFFDWVDRYVKSTAGSAAARPTKNSDHISSVDRPSQRTDANSQLAHQQLVQKARQGGIDLYFVGDSITRRWGCSDPQYAEFLANWKHNFFGWNAGNFGWGGDTVQNILWRLNNGELDGVEPKVFVILAGTNNLNPQAVGVVEAENISRGIHAILDVCRAKAPHATIIITAIFPRDDKHGLMQTIQQINEIIAKFADGDHVRFLNVNGSMTGADGKFLNGVMRDGLHPTVKGYQIWADGLRPILIELLGPPADSDHAPPPTGDPSAASTVK